MIVKVYEVGASTALSVSSRLDGVDRHIPDDYTDSNAQSAFNVPGRPDRLLRLRESMEADEFSVKNWPGAFGGDPVSVREYGPFSFAITFGRVEVHIELDHVAQRMSVHNAAGPD